MEIIRTVDQLKKRCVEIKNKNLKIAIVPTMGYLHEGHLTLIRKAREYGDFTLATLFVNPTQFGPNEDFERYPRDEKRDIAEAEKAGADALFIPDVKEMYPENYKTYVAVEGLSEKLCGKTRPGHFRGVATVCLKLFNMSRADFSIMGLKDAQQVIILRKMLKDLNVPTEIIGEPIVREKDGLAMSSRNAYLNAEERRQALVLSKSLREADAYIKGGETGAAEILEMIRKMISESPLARIDYVEMVSAETLEPLAVYAPGKTLIALAVYFGKTRLIDNLMI